MGVQVLDIAGRFLRGVFFRPWKFSISEAYGDHAYEAGAHNIEVILCSVMASYVTISLSRKNSNYLLEKANVPADRDMKHTQRT
jgi:hypothetical protein